MESRCSDQRCYSWGRWEVFSLPRPSGTSADPGLGFVSVLKKKEKGNNRRDLQLPSAIYLFFSISVFFIIFFLTEMRDFANMALRPLPAVRAGQMIRQFSASYGVARLIKPRHNPTHYSKFLCTVKTPIFSILMGFFHFRFPYIF